MLPGTLINIRFVPRIRRDFFLQIRPVPALDSARLLCERMQAFLRRRIAPYIETKGVERRAQQFDLGLGGFRRSFFFLFDELRHHQPGKQSNNGRDNDQLDEREAVLAF